MSHPRLVHRHLTRHENKAIKHHALPDDRYVLQGLLQYDVEESVHLRTVGVAHPPEVQPVRVDLMVGNHDHAFWEGELYSSIGRHLYLVGDRGVTAYPYGCRSPPLRHCRY